MAMSRSELPRFSEVKDVRTMALWFGPEKLTLPLKQGV